MGPIVVVGASGVVGSRVAAELAAHGHEVLGLSRSEGDGPAGVRRVAVDLTDRAAATRALEGARVVYLTPPESGEDPLGLERTVALNVIEAARAAGVDHLVMHTAVHVDHGDTGARILDNKHGIEASLAESGVPYTILRPAWFLQNLFGAKAWLEQGMFSLPWAEDMVWAATDVADLARAAVSFIEGAPANRGFDVHIPGGITAAEICQAVGTATGSPVQYGEAPSTRAAVDPYPISDAHKELYAELFDYFKATEYLGDPTPIQQAIDGFAYGTVEDFVRRELFPSDRAAGRASRETGRSADRPQPKEDEMVLMAIKHQVRDYDDWKAVFDTFPPTAVGALFHRVSRAGDDGNTVLVLAGFESAEAAQAFRQNPELKAKMEAAGVLDAPRFEFYEEVEVVEA
jgi:uncharacterized protein YbjT (DUF2867 family)